MQPLFPTTLQIYQQLVAYIAAHQFIVQTPAGLSYQQPLVDLIWQTNVFVADTLLALVILWSAYMLILGFYGVFEVLSRVLLSAIAVHASLQFIGLFVAVNNALCAAALSVARVPTIADIVALFGIPLTPTATGATVVEAIILIFMAMAIALQELVRLGVLDLLIAIVPLAFLVPEVMRLWLIAFFVVLFMQFLQVTALVLGAGLAVSLGATNIIATFVGIAILLFALQIPRWLGHPITHAIGGVRSPFGYVYGALETMTRRALTIIRTFR